MSISSLTSTSYNTTFSSPVIDLFKNEVFNVTRNEQTGEKIGFVEIEGKLVVVERDEENYKISDIPPQIALLRACRNRDSQNMAIKKVLLHKDFSPHLAPFIEAVLSSKLGTPKLFGFSNSAILDLLEIGSKLGPVDPSKIIDPVTGKNIFAHLGASRDFYCDGIKSIVTLAQMFPAAFVPIGEEIIIECLLNGRDFYEIEGRSYALKDNPPNLIRTFENLGGKLSPFFELLHQTNSEKKYKPDISSLSTKQRRIFYDVAYSHNNAFIHEPADVPVKPDQYSVNLMWINKNKIPADQEFLLAGDRSHFQKTFVRPIADWAKANPGTAIHVWFDGAMANPEAVRRSHEALVEELGEIPHGSIQFRDIRSIPLAQAHPQVFSERMPVYFRVDLLKAITADHVLKTEKPQYFVFADLDVRPLPGQEIFDKGTIASLDDYGCVFAKGGHLRFENSFQIWNRDNAQAMQSHQKVIIDSSIELAEKNPRQIKEQQIYDTYQIMMSHFLIKNGYCQPVRSEIVNGRRVFVPCSPSEINEKHFRYGEGQFIHYDKKETNNLSSRPLKEFFGKYIVPTKPVSVPPSHFSGGHSSL